MIRKFYDVEFGSEGGVHVVKHWEESKKTIIECDCGAHMLQVVSEKNFYENSDNSIQLHHEFYLAMFSYGNQKRNFFARCVIAWKYLRTGKMFTDQLCLNEMEAYKLADFIRLNNDKKVQVSDTTDA